MAQQPHDSGSSKAGAYGAGHQQRSIPRQRAPAVASRIRNASQEEQHFMQSARQQLHFGDGSDEEFENADSEMRNDGNHELPATRPKIPIIASENISSLMNGSAAAALPLNNNDFPDHTMILERLTNIRQHKRQVLDLIDKLKSESVDGQMDKDMLRKLIEAYDNFKEQEEQYLLILQKILELKSEYADSYASESGAEISSHASVAGRNASDRPMRSTGPQQVERDEDEVAVCDSGFSSAHKAGELDELQALVEQRDMLKRMLQQQEELRALQGHQKAQQGQNRMEPQNEAGMDCELAYQQVYSQQETLAAKRRELEELKKKLDYARSFYADAPADQEEEVSSVGANGRRQGNQLDDKLLVLRGKKQRMDEIISELNALQNTAAEAGDVQHRPRNAPGASPSGQRPPSNNQTGARPKQPTFQPAKQSSQQPSDPRTGVASGGAHPEEIRRKLMELEATKSRLAQLQTLVTELEDGGGSSIGPGGLGVSPQLLRLVNELENERERELDESCEDGAMSVEMRSAYESKLNEQRDAVDKLQEEHSRLMAIKNQLLKLNPLTDPLAAERAATGFKGNAIPAAGSVGAAGRSKDDVHREFRPVRDQQPPRRSSDLRGILEQRLNNSRDNNSSSDLSFFNQERSSHSSMVIPSGGATLGSASCLTTNLDDLDMEHQAPRSRRGTESGCSTIVSNPRLASFRRNNQLDEFHKQYRRTDETPPRQRSHAVRDGILQSTPNDNLTVAGDRTLGRRRSSSTLEQQYQQLQQHIDSIRLIFQDLMKEHEEYGGGQERQQPFLQGGAPFWQQQQPNNAAVTNTGDSGRNQANSAAAPPWDALAMSPSALTVHQHQLMLSLLACQQQLQLQQVEMRYLQQLCQELWQSSCYNEGARTRSGSVNSVHQQQPQQPPGGNFQFAAPGFMPFDGRPLSSASLYNLLAPNPYLTLPYYSPPQFGQQNFASVAARGLLRTNNGAHSLPREPGILNNSYVVGGGGTPNNASTAAKSNRNTDPAGVSGRMMSSSAVCQEGQHRGVGDRMIVSDSELSITADVTSPFKVGAMARPVPGEYASTANGCSKAMTPKLNLDDPYSKSNVNKPHNNKNSNVVMTQGNGAIPELPSRTSSASGTVTHSGHVLENGYVTPEQFDAMREIIYSEVATLISQNEQRPSFLIELFRELQLLTNDYLRARALDAIRDILNRYLTDEVETPINVDQESDRWTMIRSTAVSRSSSRVAARVAAVLGSPENDVCRTNYQHATAVEQKPHVGATASGRCVVSENASSDLAISSADKPISSQKRFENLEGIKGVKNTPLNNERVPAAGETGEASDLTRSQSGDFAANAAASSNSIRTDNVGKVDMTGLEQQIQTIVDDLMPFVRGNVDAECSPQLLQYIRKLVLELTASKCVPAESFTTFFRLQLSSILDDTLAKFRGQKLHECGAELLADVSEVVFNELGFFRLMQNIDTKLISGRQEGADSEASTTDIEARNLETSESTPLDDVVSESNGDMGGSELSSSRQSSMDDELSPLSIHDAVSEVSEDLSAITAISVSRQAEKVATAGTDVTEGTQAEPAISETLEGRTSTVGKMDEKDANSENDNDSASRRKSIETVLMAPLMVQVTAATDEEEITTTTNNSSSTSPSSGSQSMHTAGAGNSVTSDQVEMLKTPPSGGSRETTPPEDVEEVPEQLEHEPTLPPDNNDVTFDLTIEPHPEDKVELTLTNRSGKLVDESAEEEEEEEEEEDAEHLGDERSSTPVVTARAVVYLAESTSNSDVASVEATTVATVVSTVN